MDKEETRQERWQRRNAKRYSLCFFYKSDQDVIDKMDSVENKNNYVKNLIREDIKNGI